jgi:hypothetical protein
MYSKIYFIVRNRAAESLSFVDPLILFAVKGTFKYYKCSCRYRNTIRNLL